MITLTEALVEAPDGAAGTLAIQRDTLLPKLVLGEVGVGVVKGLSERQGMTFLSLSRMQG